MNLEEIRERAYSPVLGKSMARAYDQSIIDVRNLLEENERLSQRVTRLSNLERRNAKQRDEARARLAAVEKLHSPVEAIAANGDTITVCDHCVGDLAYVFDEQLNWPCPTIKAVKGETND